MSPAQEMVDGGDQDGCDFVTSSTSHLLSTDEEQLAFIALDLDLVGVPITLQRKYLPSYRWNSYRRCHGGGELIHDS